MESTNITLGITLGIFSGLLHGSFALPMKKVKTWQWEHTWVMFSLWGTIVLPLMLAFITVPDLFSVYMQTPFNVLVVVFLFGAGWGVANVGFGIGLNMVGLAMGTAIVLGLNNAIGAILPIFLYNSDKILQPIGLTISAGVLVMIAGIIFCAIAGMKREKATEAAGRKFYAETFPIFWPNLGPEVFSAFHECELEYAEVTSYSIPLVKEKDCSCALLPTKKFSPKSLKESRNGNNI